MQINPVSQLYRDFMTILDQTVVKYSTIADNNETLDIKKEADLFVNAYYKEDTFFTYYRYEKSIIAEVMNIIDEEEILGYHLDRNTIPAKYRDMMLKKQREFIIDNYVEKNNYLSPNTKKVILSKDMSMNKTTDIFRAYLEIKQSPLGLIR